MLDKKVCENSLPESNSNNIAKLILIFAQMRYHMSYNGNIRRNSNKRAISSKCVDIVISARLFGFYRIF